MAHDAAVLDSGIRSVIAALPDPVAIVRATDDGTRDLVIVQANEAARRYAARASMHGTTLGEAIPEWRASGLLDHLLDAVSTGHRVFVEEWAVEEEHTGATYCEVHLASLGTEYVLSWRDVTEIHAARQRTAEAEERYRIMAEHVQDVVFTLDARGAIQWVSPGVTRVLGYRSIDLIGWVATTMVNPADLPTLRLTESHASAGTSATCRVRVRNAQDHYRWVELTLRGLLNADQDFIGMVVGLRDIHAEVQATDALRQAETVDPLTGLARRELGLDRIGRLVETLGDQAFVICVGVDSLKVVNDAFTYSGGDTVLATVARRLVEVTGSEDLISRISGDEFAVTCEDITSRDEAAAMAERILDAVHGPIEIAGGRIMISACAGIASAADAKTPDLLLRDASAAMRQAARKGPDRWEFLDGDVGAEALHALSVHEGLTLALDAGHVRPWLMPIVSLGTGHIVGYEALARWVHHDGTANLPEFFLPVAERSRLILTLDRFMITATLELVPSLPEDIGVAINLSAASLEAASLDHMLFAEVERLGVNPGRIHLEVTETDLFRATDSVRARMHRIADAGFQWWIDDFGVGFSPISHLRDLPIAGLKLDQSFTDEVTHSDSRAFQLSRGLAGLASGLGLLTVAEGIETPAQAAILSSQGWQMGQGYLFGRAAPLPLIDNID